MDNLKNFIDTHREEFEEETLPQGHELRFEEKLKKGGRSKTRSLLLLCGAIVAAIFVMLVLIRPSIQLADPPADLIGSGLCENNEEINEMKNYYQARMHTLLDEFNSAYGQTQMPALKELLAESERIVTDTELFEREVLPGLPCSDQSLYVLKTHYDSSLNSLLYLEKQIDRIVNN